MYCNFGIRLPHFEKHVKWMKKKNLHITYLLFAKFATSLNFIKKCYMCPWYIKERFVFLRIELDSPGCNGPDKIFFVMVKFYHSNSRHIFIVSIFIKHRSDHSLSLSVTDWLTHSLTNSLKIEWIDLNLQTMQTM